MAPKPAKQLEGREFNAVVFGATGFTGRFVALEMASGRLSNGRSFSNWAVCGRSESKLKKLVDELKSKFPDAEEPATLVCDLEDTEGMRRVASKCQVLLNAVGPYRYYGKRVVQACIDASTHYLDLCGEPEFIEGVSRDFHDTAIRKGITLVSAAAFDSVPCDLGVLEAKRALEKASPGCVPSAVEMSLRIHPSDKGVVGHYATYQAAVEGFGSAKDLAKLRSELKKTRPQVPQVGPRPKMKTGPLGLPPWDQRIGGYVVPYFFSDPAVVRLGQTVDLMLGTKTPPASMSAYLVIPTLSALLLLAPFYLVFNFLARRPWGRNILLKYPGVFTYGSFSHEGPTQAQIDGTSFTMTFHASGYSSTAIKAAGGVDALTNTKTSAKPDVSTANRCVGCEPGYAATPVLFVACLVALLANVPKKAVPAGVLTPAVAFGKTDLVELLNKDGRVRFVAGSK